MATVTLLLSYNTPIVVAVTAGMPRGSRARHHQHHNSSPAVIIIRMVIRSARRALSHDAIGEILRRYMIGSVDITTRRYW